MSITGLGPTIDPRINAKTEPQAKVDTTPKMDKGPGILTHEPVNVLARQIEEIKGGVQISDNKASPGEIQDSGIKLAKDSTSSENLKTNFKAENFEKATGIEPQQGTTPPHENTTVIDHHEGTTQTTPNTQTHETSTVNLDKNETQPVIDHHKDTTPSTQTAINTNEAKIITDESNIIYGLSKIGDNSDIAKNTSEIVEPIANLFKKSEKAAEIMEKGFQVIGATASFVGGVVNIVSGVSNIKAIGEIKEERKTIGKEIEAINKEIASLPPNDPQIAGLEKTRDDLTAKSATLKTELKDKKMEVLANVTEVAKSGLEFADAIGKTVGPKLIPGLGLIVSGIEIAQSVSKIHDLVEKKQEVKAEIRAQKEIINNPDSTPKQVEDAKGKLEDLNKEKKGINKEIRQEIIKGGLALASGVVSLIPIPGVGAAVGATISLSKTLLEKHWENQKDKEGVK